MVLLFLMFWILLTLLIFVEIADIVVSVTDVVYTVGFADFAGYSLHILSRSYSPSVLVKPYSPSILVKSSNLFSNSSCDG